MVNLITHFSSSFLIANLKLAILQIAQLQFKFKLHNPFQFQCSSWTNISSIAT